MRPYVELKAKSAYSLLEGALRVKDLAKRCAARDMPALGIADTDNLFGSLEISEELAKAGIQPPPLLDAGSGPAWEKRCLDAGSGPAWNCWLHCLR